MLGNRLEIKGIRRYEARKLEVRTRVIQEKLRRLNDVGVVWPLELCRFPETRPIVVRI